MATWWLLSVVTFYHMNWAVVKAFFALRGKKNDACSEKQRLEVVKQRTFWVPNIPNILMPDPIPFLRPLYFCP